MDKELASPYRSWLPPAMAIQYLAWKQANNVPDQNTGFNSVYDMPGYYKDIVSKGQNKSGINSSDGQLHYPDTYKTPFHPTFSNESKYKFKGIDRDWIPNNDGTYSLMDNKLQKIIRDERATGVFSGLLRG